MLYAIYNSIELIRTEDKKYLINMYFNGNIYVLMGKAGLLYTSLFASSICSESSFMKVL